jgi:HPt (histidine-containing phosphotransfer) domain-containing protein
MREALDRSDFVQVAFLSHGMRGAGGMFGFPAITDIGACLEDSADRLDKTAARKWVEELSRCLDRAGAAAPGRTGRVPPPLRSGPAFRGIP